MYCIKGKTKLARFVGRTMTMFYLQFFRQWDPKLYALTNKAFKILKHAGNNKTTVQTTKPLLAAVTM